MASSARSCDGVLFPANEADRLVALEQYQVLDTAPEQAYDDIAELARQIFGTEHAGVAFLDEHRVWTKASTVELGEGSRADSFCQHAVLTPHEVMVVEDALADERFRSNPHVLGEPRLRFYAAAPLVNRDGFALGVVCVVDSKPRQPSPEQVKALQMLAKQVASQLELRRHTRELEIARDAALGAAKTKSAFLANMSHHVRTPMNGVMGVSSLLKQTQLDDGQRMLVNTIEQSAGGLLAMLNEVLDYADHKADRTILVNRTVDVRQLVEEISQTARPVAMKRNLRFHTRASSATGAQLNTDPLKLREILLELLDNALKFTLEGCVELQVKRVGRAVRFSVRDTGIGIPPDLLPALEEPFTQLHLLPQWTSAGAGIGLSTVRELLRLMGAVLHIETEAGVGSTFWFELPLAPQHSEVAALAS